MYLSDLRDLRFVKNFEQFKKELSKISKKDFQELPKRDDDPFWGDHQTFDNLKDAKKWWSDFKNGDICISHGTYEEFNK